MVWFLRSTLFTFLKPSLPASCCYTKYKAGNAECKRPNGIFENCVMGRYGIVSRCSSRTTTIPDKKYPQQTRQVTSTLIPDKNDPTYSRHRVSGMLKTSCIHNIEDILYPVYRHCVCVTGGKSSGVGGPFFMNRKVEYPVRNFIYFWTN